MGTPTTSPRSGQDQKRYKVGRRPKQTRPPETHRGRSIRKRAVTEALVLLAELHKVYALVDPRDGLVRAVGEAATPLCDRLARYLWAAGSGRSGRIYDWIRELDAAGMRPTIIRLGVDTEAEGFDLFPPGQLRNEQPAGSGPAPALEWTVEWVRVLGRLPDHVIADLRGVSRQTISRARRSMGIPSYRDWRAANST